MSYWDDETSLIGSVPVELHAFETDTLSWFYADAINNFDYDGNTYTASTIHGDPVESTASAVRNRTKIKCNWELPFVWQYIQSPPDGIVSYTRYRLQGSNAVTLYMGSVLSVTFKQSSRNGQRHAEILIDPFTGDMQTSGLTIRYDRKCSVPLYSDLCGVDKDASGVAWNDTGVLTGVSGLTLQAAEFALQADGWWTGGMINVNSRTRKIVSHSGTSIVISSTIPGVAVGQAFTVYAGCDRLYTTCNTKFNNVDNCKAHPNIPYDDSNPLGQKGLVL